MARRLVALLLLVALPAAAQLADPTRPPSSVATPADAAAAPVQSAVLQSVILRQGGKPAALISGVVVELGGQVGEAKLVKIQEDAVVLRGPQGDETLRLIPDAEKKAKVGAGKTAQPAKGGARQ